MSQKPEISIIVPVYKVEKYLRQCLESILSQTFVSWECIVVDDGSPDGCGAICDEFAARDTRFRVIHKPNEGLSIARNTALKAAEGAFIAFVDSDDWVEPEYLQTLYDLIIEYDADVSQIGIIREYTTFTRPLTFSGDIRVLTGHRPFAEIMRDKTVRSYVWNKLYRREIVQEGFPEGRLFEDVYAQSNWFARVHKMVLSPKMLYHYRMRRGSILNSDIAKNRIDHFAMCRYRADMMKKVDPEDFPESRRNAYLYVMAVNCAKNIARFEKDTDKRDAAIETISKQLRDIPDPGMAHLSPKRWFRARTLRNSPAFFGRLMRIMYKTQIGNKRYYTHLYE